MAEPAVGQQQAQEGAKGAGEVEGGQPDKQQQQSDRREVQQPPPPEQPGDNATGQLAERKQQQQQQQQQVPDCITRLGNCTLVQDDPMRRVWRCEAFCGRPCLIKAALQQPSSHPYLARKRANDFIKQDVLGMVRARRLGVLTPLPLHTDLAQRCVYLEDVAGTSLQQHLAAADPADAGAQQQLLSELGRVLAVMHDGGLLHGDLRPANVLVRQQDQALVLANFEASFSSTNAQEKAADLVVLEQGLQAAQQPEAAKAAFAAIMTAYNKRSKQWSAVFNRLAEARCQQQKRHKKK